MPLILLLLALYAALLLRARKRRRQAIIAKLAPDRVVDVDIFTRGISMSCGSATVEVDWTGVSDILADRNRIELECEGFVIYIPARAFAGNAAYVAAQKEIRQLWRDAVKLDRDRKMVEAGLD